jgi:serine/threonine protein kinase
MHLFHTFSDLMYIYLISMTGKVYLGSLEDEPELGYLAIKLLRIGFSEKASDRIDRESCLRELTVLSGGGIEPHPNICRARRAFFQAKTGTVIVAMELMACSLGQLLKKCGRMPEEYAIHIFYEVIINLYDILLYYFSYLNIF